MRTIGFIGVGNMAGAIIGGMISSHSEDRILAYNPHIEKILAFGGKVSAAKDNIQVARESDLIFLAIKPQMFSSVLDELRPVAEELRGKTLVTMAAGISIAAIQTALGEPDLSVIRIMPNTPMLLGCGAIGLAASPQVSTRQKNEVMALLAVCGRVVCLPEEQINTVTAVSGSSPAYLFLMAKAVCDYAQQAGMPKENALTLFAQTLAGSARMLTETGKTPDELIAQVTSPGGTTLAALEVLHSEGFCDSLMHAMAACQKRAEELGR